MMGPPPKRLRRFPPQGGAAGDRQSRIRRGPDGAAPVVIIVGSSGMRATTDVLNTRLKTGPTPVSEGL